MTECVTAQGCITCGDEAAPMQVLEIDDRRGLALCADPEGERASVEIALVEPVAPGEVLLVHAGTALGRAAERDAAERDGLEGGAVKRDGLEGDVPGRDAPQRDDTERGVLA
jgi:hydrogenase maturation factor